MEVDLDKMVRNRLLGGVVVVYDLRPKGKGASHVKS